MYIISVLSEENGYPINEAKAYLDCEVEHLKAEFKVMFPNKPIRVSTYVPRTKETAEKEIENKKKML